MKFKNKKGLPAGRQGFTLVELLVVVTIIAILSVTAFIALGGQTLKARNAKRHEHLTTIQSALEIFVTQSSTSRYPAEASWLSELSPAFISEIPQDPSSTASSPKPYFYRVDDQTNPKHFQLGATLENEDGSGYTALVVGNATGNLIKGPSSCDVINGGTACLPYTP